MTTPLQTSIQERSFDSPSQSRSQVDKAPYGMNLTQAEEMTLQRAFDVFCNGKEYLVVGDLKEVFDELLTESSNQKASIRSRSLQRLSDRLASLEAYQRLSRAQYLALFVPEPKEDPIQHLFQLFDIENKGYIDVEDLTRVAAELGEAEITDDELQDMIDRYATDGRVTLQQFQSMLEQKLFTEI